MLLIEHNIPEVVAGLRAYRDGFAAAVQRAIAPERWFDELKAEAELALLNGAGTEELWAVQKFLELMGRMFLGDSTQFYMDAPQGNDSSALAGAVDVARRTSPYWRKGSTIETLEQPDLLDRVTVQQAMQMIQEWVMEGGKRLTEEDQKLMGQQGRFSNELVERLWHIFGIHPADLGRFEVSDAQEEAIRNLTPHIVEFFSGRSENGLDPATIDLWLRRVLAAWTQYMTDHLRFAVEEELGKI